MSTKAVAAWVVAWSVAVVVAGSSVASAEEGFPEDRRFQSGTAYTLDQGSLEVGFFGPLRYGITDRLEVQGHPLAFFVAPNARLRATVIDDTDSALAMTAGLTYPTPLLRLLAREGAGGVLPPDRAVPHVVSLFGEVSGSRRLGEHVLTGAAGVQVAPRFGENELVTVELPVVYPRTAAFHTSATAIFRARLLGPVVGPVGYALDGRIFVFPGVDGAFGAEGSAQVRWRIAERWLLQAGVLLTHGGYPFGVDRRVLPLVDLVWAPR